MAKVIRATVSPGASSATAAGPAGRGAWEPSPLHHRMARAIVKTLSTEDLVGAVMVIGVDSYEYTPSLHKAVKEGRWPEFSPPRRDHENERRPHGKEVRGLAPSPCARNQGDSLPLIIASDDEGGHFNNYPYAYREWPNNLAVAAVNDTTKAYEYGREYGKNIRSTGINGVRALHGRQHRTVEPRHWLAVLRIDGRRAGWAWRSWLPGVGGLPDVKAFSGTAALS